MAKKKTDDEVIIENKADKKKLLKEIDEYVNSQKEELTKDIASKIEEQINFQVSKKMKEEEKRIVRGKNGKIIRRDMVIVVLLVIIGYFGYCLYDGDYFNIRTKEIEVKETANNNEVLNEIDNEEINEVVENQYDSAYLLENFGYLVDNLQINDTEVFDLYNKNVTSDDISNSLKLKLAYYNLDKSLKEKDSNDMITINADDLINSLQKVLGKDTTIKNEVFTYNNTKFMFYNNTYLGFYLEETNINLEYQIIKASLKDNKLSFDVVVAKLQDDSLLDLNDKVVVKNYEDENIINYLDKLPKYKITFELIDNDYVFSSIKES